MIRRFCDRCRQDVTDPNKPDWHQTKVTINTELHTIDLCVPCYKAMHVWLRDGAK